MIDVHTHLRWNEQDRDYISLAVRDCLHCGVEAISEMPNTTPALTTEESIIKRLRHYATPTWLRRYINVGLTADPKQIREAVQLVGTLPVCTALKMFLTHSTGNMGIINLADQRTVWRTLVECGYKGVVMLHCEDENEWYQPFDPKNPVSHSWRQNPESEYLQVEDQLSLAELSGFQGTFYVCHVSNPATLDLLENRKHIVNFRIASEVTWHHMLLNWEDYKIHGNRVKMNPPLRSSKMQESLFNQVLLSRVDVIGSDHAPHPVEKKDSDNPPSGIPALPFWPKGLQILLDAEMESAVIWNMINDTPAELFNIDVPVKTLDQHMKYTYDPRLWEAYGWNPFSRVDGTC